jgi:PEP-CTERM motif
VRSANRLLFVAGLLTAFASHLPADTVWNVNATFSYNALGNTATGTFELDPSLNMVTWNTTVSGTNAAADNVYTPGDSISVYPDSTHIDFYDGTTNQYIDLYLQTGVTNAGGTINLLYGDGGASSNSTIVCAGCGTLVQGTVSTSSVPEPSSLALVGGAIAAIGFARRRKRAPRSTR